MSYANTKLNSSDFENCYLVDYALDASDDISELLTSLASHPEYFGNHIDEIKLVVKNIPLGNVIAMGANKDSMKISYNNIDYVRFKDLNFVESIFGNRMKTLTVFGRCSLNSFMGKTTTQFIVEDYELVNDDHKYDF